jgi:hypothetical protein
MLLLREQQAEGFRGVAGTHVSATVPLSDRLLTRVILERLPPSAPIRSLDLRASPGGRLTAHVRLARPAFLPPFTFPITILQQPELPHSPVLVLRIGSPGGLLKLVGPLMRLGDVLPPGVSLQNDRITVDLHTVLTTADAAFVLRFLEHLEIGTDDGRVIVSVRARVPTPPGAELPPKPAVAADR